MNSVLRFLAITIFFTAVAAWFWAHHLLFYSGKELTGEQTELAKYILVNVKPVPALSLILVVLSKASSSRVSILTTLALILGAAGDYFLAIDKSYFLHGLGAFLLSHIFYVNSFLFVNKKSGLMLAIPFFAASAGLFLWINPFLKPELSIPVAIYVLNLTTMAWRAACCGAIGRTIGAISFLVSDLLLAINEFAFPIQYSGFLVLGTYWLAQFLLADAVDQFAVSEKKAPIGASKQKKQA